MHESVSQHSVDYQLTVDKVLIECPLSIYGDFDSIDRDVDRRCWLRVSIDTRLWIPLVYMIKIFFIIFVFRVFKIVFLVVILIAVVKLEWFNLSIFM